MVKQCSFGKAIELAGSPKDAALPALDSIQYKRILRLIKLNWKIMQNYGIVNNVDMNVFEKIHLISVLYVKQKEKCLLN